MVSEAGASVYSASAYASRELPGMDVSLRGAVSIARRLQDPLAELVKIDPKSIGVGQYQHDLTEGKLSRSLDAVVEDCVNAVGVDVNTASAPLLARVSGIGDGLAITIVAHRNSAAPFRSRQALTDVPRLGPKAFEQCAGFLRISGGDEPLDASSVHPEAYPVARRILAAAGTTMPQLSGNTAGARARWPRRTSPTSSSACRRSATSWPSWRSRAATRARPSRPRRLPRAWRRWRTCPPGMILEGVVTNVAAFGAFVDVGVHQDGLVHVSAMSRNFVSDPREVAKSGDVVRVKVLSVDVPRKRISLTLRLDDESADAPAGRAGAGAVRGAATGGGRGRGEARRAARRRARRPARRQGRAGRAAAAARGPAPAARRRPARRRAGTAGRRTAARGPARAGRRTGRRTAGRRHGRGAAPGRP